ncbi:hypothetical protein VNO77_35906 [Canavalia gladiata]|uniref:Uncharacterized protein n=1 Tax=Canavalia gladiata TaxID=3824 RepID=A0AAN9K7C0_CANGL
MDIGLVTRAIVSNQCRFACLGGEVVWLETGVHCENCDCDRDRERWEEDMDMVKAQPTKALPYIIQSAGTLSPARACAPSCGFGYCTGQSKMLLLYWAGGIPGRVTMIMARGISIPLARAPRTATDLKGLWFCC